MTTLPLIVERRGPAAVLTLNRPEARNAISVALGEALVTALTDAEQDPEVRAIVLTGAGDVSFCAGADLKERATMGDEQVKRFLGTLGEALQRIERMDKPVIAAINGFALGGGLELALTCDIRIAAESATMGLTEVRLGIIPGGGGTQRLPRVVGIARAKELIFTGRRVAADEAERIGLVNAMVPDGELVDRAVAMAEAIALGAPLAVAQAKRAIQDGMQTDLASGLGIERACYATLIPTEDRLEALAAFAQKRPPVFKGR